MEMIKLFCWAFLATFAVAISGSAIDALLIDLIKKAWLRPKWLWNLGEGIIVVLLVSWKFGSFTPFPWWHMAPLYTSMAFMWWAIHDCFIGWLLKNNWWYLGQSKFDREMFAIFNQFGLPAGLNFLIVKLFWAGMAGAAFFSL